MNWIKTKLGKIGKEVRSSYKPNKQQSLAYIGYEHIDQQTLRLIGSGKSNETQSDKKRFSAGDIIFGTLRPYFRKVVIPNFSGVCSTDLAVIRAQEGYDQKFLFYILASQPLIDYADVSSNGTKMPRAKWNVLAQTEWLAPNFFSQQQIAFILGAYDELIEVNTQRIKFLEETANQLYKEWFVRMRFPNYRNIKFAKGIPEGWKIKKVGNAFSVLGGGTPSTEIEDYWNGNINWFTPTDVTGSDSIFLSEATDKITEKGLKKSSASLFPPYSIMMTSRATIGAVGINTAYSCTNQGFITCLPNEELPYTYLYHWICSNKETFEMLASGSTFLEITKGSFKKIPILIPEKDIINKYHKIVDPLFNQISILQQQNTQLRQIRDRLLPRLISGKLQVPMEAKGKVISMTAKPELNIVADEKAAYKKSNPYFKRRVLAAYIIDTLKDDSTFGHVKLMKLMFLCEYLVKIETASNYHRDAAGLYDNKMMRSIDIQLKKSNWFEAIKMQRENHTYYLYKPLAKCDEYKEWFEKYYANKKNLIDELIALFGKQKTQKVEMVATLYKAWLDLSKEQDYVSEDELVYEVLNNWHDSKKQIDESHWKKCIVWMNNKQWITT